MAFQPQEFIDQLLQTPSLDLISGLKKSDLLAVGKHLQLEVKQAMRKDEIKRIVVEHYVDDNVLPHDVLQNLPPVVSGTDFEIKKLEMELHYRLEMEKEKAELERKRLEAEQKRLEAEQKRLETEQEQKRLELEQARENKRIEAELEEKRIKAEKEVALRKAEVQESVAQRQSETFDATKQIRLVPPFHEKDVDKYFQQFEKLAIRLKWPTDYWTTLLQSVLKGKAQEVFSKLTVEQSSDYQHVKKCILNAYELVPEAYRQKFRGYKKFDNQTYVEFAREKETLFDRWCDSKEIKDDYKNLRELMLIEEFKRCIPVELKTYIDEQKASELHDAAILADEYALTHKDVTSKNKNSFSPKKSNDSAKTTTNVQGKDKTDQTSSDSHAKTSSHSQSASSNKNTSSNKTCAYCKKTRSFDL